MKLTLSAKHLSAARILFFACKCYYFFQQLIRSNKGKFKSIVILCLSRNNGYVYICRELTQFCHSFWQTYLSLARVFSYTNSARTRVQQNQVAFARANPSRCCCCCRLQRIAAKPTLGKKSKRVIALHADSLRRHNSAAVLQCQQHSARSNGQLECDPHANKLQMHAQDRRAAMAPRGAQ